MRGSVSVNSPSVVASNWCIPRLALCHMSMPLFTLPPLPGLLSPHLLLSFLPGLVPTSLSGKSSQIPADVPSQPRICLLPLSAMTVGGWDCVWGKAG